MGKLLVKCPDSQLATGNVKVELGIPGFITEAQSTVATWVAFELPSGLGPVDVTTIFWPGPTRLT